MDRDMIYSRIADILPQFAFDGSYSDVDVISAGNVNSTYHLYFRTAAGTTNEYILQQINTYVFRKPDELTENIVKVTKHLSNKLLAMGQSPDNRVLECIPLCKGGYLYRDEEERCWRAYGYIRNAVAYDRIEKPEHFREAGRAFGEFQKMLSDFPANELHDTIPHFHDTRSRFYTFVASVAADSAGRAKDLEPEIDFFFERRKMMTGIVKGIEQGRIPLRVAHNDTKINNIMIDRDTGRAACVLDLDTVMPGTALFDYADAVRFGACTAAEDEPELTKIGIDLTLLREFTAGFLSEVGTVFTPEELVCLPLSLKVITAELAMRFLTDYLDGDVYFKINYPEHNLVRARAQMKLLTEIEAHYDEICAITIDLLRSGCTKR